MRKYLAPYIFKIKGVSLENFFESLNALIADGFQDPEKKTYLKINEVHKEKLLIFGFAEYGTFGETKNVIGILTQQYSTPILKEQSVLGKFFFYFSFINGDSGIFISQRTGNVGIRTILEEALKNKQKGLMFSITPITVNFKDFKNKAIKKISISIPKLPREIEGKITQEGWLENREEIEVQIILSAKRGHSIISPRISGILESIDKIYNKEASYIGLIDPNEEMRVEFDIGKSERTITLNTGKFRNWMEIPPEINEIPDLLKEANAFKDEIISKLRVGEE